MPKATVTLREVKNADSGIDITIASMREVPGLFGKSVLFQVVVVSWLQCFKTPKNKETDVVQFMVEKQNDDFANLRKQLCQKFPSIRLPLVPSSLLDFNTNSADRKANLDIFLSAIASNSMLATCYHTLEFLGVRSISSGKFTSSDASSNPQRLGAKSLDSAGLFDDNTQIKGNLFSEANDEADEDLFLPKQKLQEDAYGESLDDRIFESQDLGGAVGDADEDQFLVPGAKDIPNAEELSLEDNFDLLNINDSDVDLLEKKLALKPKPKPKPKPCLPTKPKSASTVVTESDKTSQADMGQLGHSDILAYIKQNTQAAEDDDLFS